MKDRFDLENEITKLHTFADDLSTLSEGILEHSLSRDEIVNAVEGLRVMLTLQANKLMDTMSQCFKLDQYRGLDDVTEGKDLTGHDVTDIYS